MSAAAAFSVALHGGMAFAVMDAAGVYGRAKAPSPSSSAETMIAIVLDAVEPTNDAEPPVASVAAAETISAVRSVSKQHVPETQLEKAEATRPSAGDESAPTSPPLSAEERSDTVDVATPATSTSEVAPEQTRVEAENMRRREEQRRKSEREMASPREADAAEKRLRQAVQQAKQRQKKERAERDQRRSVAAHGVPSQKSGSARVTASRGDVLAYAALVRARVASRRPTGIGRGGTVVVAFGVSDAGGISYVRLSRSSGDPALDQAALSAVRSAGPFPRPPDARSHGFTMPFHFN